MDNEFQQKIDNARAYHENVANGLGLLSRAKDSPLASADDKATLQHCVDSLAPVLSNSEEVLEAAGESPSS